MTNTPLEENDSPRVFRMVNVEVICGTLYPLLKEKNSALGSFLETNHMECRFCKSKPKPSLSFRRSIQSHGLPTSLRILQNCKLTGYLHLGLLVSMGKLLNLVN